MTGETATQRRLFEIRGDDRWKFLDGLITNDVSRCADGLVYAALLTPQGKYLADFLLHGRDDAIVLDVHADIADSLMRRLKLYKLRADVQITPSELHVLRGIDTPPEGALTDPRHELMGWRLYTQEAGTAPVIDWDARRAAGCIPETGIELIPEETFILEAGFERLNGVDHRKGCYVGQEVTARMKHKTELRKGLVTVQVEGAAPVGTEITRDGKRVGQLFTQADGLGIAHLRFARAGSEMRAGDALLRWPDAQQVRTA